MSPICDPATQEQRELKDQHPGSRLANGFKGWDLGFRIEGLGFKGLGFRVSV